MNVVAKAVPDISVTVNETEGTAVIEVPADATGNVTVKIDGVEYDVIDITETPITVDISDLMPGEHTIEVIYSGNDNYTSASDMKSFNVPKVDDYNITVDAIVDENSVDITVTLPENVTGPLLIDVDGVGYYANVTGGQAKLHLDNLTKGDHDVVVNYPGDDYYAPNGNVTSFTIDEKETQMKVDVEDGKIVIELPDDATGEVTVTIDGENQTVPVVNGKAVVDISDLEPGNHTVNVTYPGDDKYSSASASTIVEVPKETDYPFIVTEEDGKIVINVPEDATGNVTVTIDGEEYDVPIVDGKAVVDIPSDLEPGNHTVNVTYSGDDKYAPVTESTIIEVPKTDDYSINITEEDGKLVIDVPDDATGNVTVTIDGEEYTVPVEDGKAVVDISDLEPGKHAVEVTYPGDDKYAPVSNATVIEIPKVGGYDISVDAKVDGNSVDITVNLPKDIDGVVLINVGDVGYYANVTNGKAKLHLSDVDNGYYDVTAKYLGDDYYASGENKTSFTIDAKVIPELDISVDIPENSTGGTVSVELPEDASGNVTVVIDGKVYDVADVVNGTAVIPVDNLTPGNHTVEVIYSGDDNYAPASNYTNVEVPKITDFTMDVTSNNITEGQTEEIAIELPSDVNGIVAVDVGGIGYYVNITNGLGKLSVADLAAGEYTAVVKFIGDDKYAPLTNSTKFTVKAKETADIEIEVGNDTIEITLPDDATGNVTVVIDGENYTFYNITEGSNRTITVDVSDLLPGNHTVEVIYSGDGNYTNKTIVTPVEIPKVDKYSMNVSSEVDGRDVIITVELPDDASGVVLVDVDGKGYYANVTDGKAVLTLNDVGNGDHEAVVTYLGDDYYASKSDSTSFTVDAKVVPELDISVDIPENSTSGVVSVELPEDASGNVTVVIDGKVYDVADVVNGTAVVPVDDLASGNHTVEVIYSGDDNYAPASNYTNVEVPKVTEYDMKVSSVVDGRDVTITVELPKDAKGVVLVDVGGKGYYANVTDGKATLTLNDVKDGDYTAVVTYLGDDYYASKSDSTSFTVDAKVVPELDISVDIPENSTSGVVSVELPEDASGNVTVVIDGKVYDVADVVNGTAVVPVDDLAPGNHTVEVIYSGDDNYAPASNYTNVEVPKIIDYEFDLNAEDILKGDKTNITVKLPEDINGVVLIDLDGIGYYINVTDGVGSLELPLNLAPGIYDVAATFKGNDKYGAKSTIDSFKVIDSETTLNIDVKDGKVIVELPEDATGNVTVTINGEDRVVPVEGGKATLDISDLEPGDYEVVAIYSGDGKYAPATNSTSFNVPKISDYPVDVVKDGDELVITVPEDATGDVTVTIDGKEYNVPIVNGTAKLDISDLPSGNHNVVVTYHGNDKYESKTVETTITKERSLIISVPDVVKYFSGPERLVIYTFDSDGNNVSNITVIITVNGVPYTRTSTDGRSSLALNLPSGNYTVKVEFAGNDEFGPQELESHVEILSTIYAKDVLKVFRNGTHYNALFLDGEGNPLVNTAVTFNIHGVFYTRTTNATGWAKLNINIQDGHYIITAFNPVTGEMKSNNVTVFSLIESSDLVKHYRNDTQFVIRVRADDGTWAKAGEEVTFNIHGVFYTRYTNETGHIKLNINIQPGEYIITSYYKDCVEGNRITVLPRLITSDLTMTRGDGSVFTAKTLDEKGNIAPHQLVKFNIQGILYNRTTDDNGEARIHINLPAGEYLITSYYLFETNGNKVTIRE